MPDDRFLNRELSWLAFNERVLSQAADDSIPILERAKFLAITSSNLDEFMMVRVGGLKILSVRNPSLRDPAGMAADEQLKAVAKKGHEIVTRQYRVYRDEVQPQMESAGITQIDLARATEREISAARDRFEEEVFPVLSPQTVSAESFPLLLGQRLHLCVRLKHEADHRLGTMPGESGGNETEPGGAGQGGDDDPTFEYAIMPIGQALPRVLPLSRDQRHGYVLLENLATHFIDDFFPGRTVVECIPFRLTRNADIELREDEAGDLLGGMEEVLESRRVSRAVRLEYGANATQETVSFLRDALQLTDDDLYAIDGPIDLSFLFALHGEKGFDDQ
ncbi:MAG: RNA degradosome polyphosphate kinase, partial [Planctomycetota bacterium]